MPLGAGLAAVLAAVLGAGGLAAVAAGFLAAGAAVADFCGAAAFAPTSI